MAKFASCVFPANKEETVMQSPRKIVYGNGAEPVTVRNFFRDGEWPVSKPFGNNDTQIRLEENAREHAKRGGIVSISQTYDLWKDRPFIICGAGPSLNSDLARLQQMIAGGAVVIAINRAYRILGGAKIFFALDRNCFAENWLWQTKHNATLITTPTANYQVRDADWKHVYYFRVPSMDIHLPSFQAGRFKHLDWLETGLTTVNVAMHYAFLAGASEVVLCGCDECWQEQMKYYADSKPNVETENQTRSFRAMDNHGNRVWMSMDNWQQAQFTSAIVELCWEEGFKVYKAQEFGMIDAPVKPLSEVTK